MSSDSDRSEEEAVANPYEVGLEHLEQLSKPTFLHPTSILFDVLKSARQLLLPAVIGIWGASNGRYWWLGLAVISLVLTLLGSLFRYLTLRYSVQDDEFLLKEGLLFRRVRSVPLKRIQNVDLVQNVLHRLFGVAEVNIETAAGTKPEATLRVLTNQQVSNLRRAIFAGETAIPSLQTDLGGPNAQVIEDYSDASQAEVATTVATDPQPGEPVYAIPTNLLIKAGLANNRGSVLLGVLIGLYFQFSEFGWEGFQRESWMRVEGLASWQGVTLLLLGGILFLLLLRVLSVAWYIQRFYGHKLIRVGDDLRISCGLFTRVSATVPRKRIQVISVHRSWLMRWMGLSSIRIETAGGAGDDGENASATVSRKWFLPVVESQEVPRILEELRPQVNWDHALDLETAQRVAPRTERRLWRRCGLLAVMLAIAGLAIQRPWGWLAGLFALPLLIFVSNRQARAIRYKQEHWGIAYRSGVLTEKMSFAFYDRMQTLAFGQSPFDRKWNMATLKVDTAAVGPAEHGLIIRYLDEDFAREQLESLRRLASQHRPVWN